MITNPNMSEQDTRELLEEYFQSGCSIPDFCFLKETIQEDMLTELIRKHYPDRTPADESPFLDINITKESPETTVRYKKNPPAKAAGSLFARIGDIELYHQVSAAYLKSLKS